MTKFKPWNGNILIKPEENESPDGIQIVQNNAKETPQVGTVVACDSELLVGLKVLYKKYAGDELLLDGVVHLVVGEDDVLGEFEDEQTS
jgi:co-chaperonin GroES (HSP10)